ncbi:YbaB/EbfC family nucleoid-associated protein [Actinoplanes sp. NPDC051851]|uniref:YbaB/EbfC family nucleoid-associated protein n=1 Tax=Actinoplanes sp. NPDC051851 TaxID=3154753 RepID=UPI003436274D
MERETSTDWLARTVQDTMSRLEKIKDIRDELTEISGEASSPGGEVRAVVAPSGMIRSLELGRTAYRLAPEDLADAIVATIHEAARNGAEALSATLQPIVGDRIDLTARLADYDTPDDQELDSARTSLREFSRENGNRQSTSGPRSPHSVRAAGSPQFGRENGGAR